MARRSAPPGSGPSYLPSTYGSDPSGRRLAEPESFLTSFLNEKIFAPHLYAGNLSIGVAVTMFLGGIFAIRGWGDRLTMGM